VTAISPDELWNIYINEYFTVMSVADFCDNFKKHYLNGKCVNCGFNHLPGEMCREAESWMDGDGFIAYKDGLYIKPMGAKHEKVES
jgi:hypothetical protein